MKSKNKRISPIRTIVLVLLGLGTLVFVLKYTKSCTPKDEANQAKPPKKEEVVQKDSTVQKPKRDVPKEQKEPPKKPDVAKEEKIKVPVCDTSAVMKILRDSLQSLEQRLSQTGIIKQPVKIIVACPRKKQKLSKEKSFSPPPQRRTKPNFPRNPFINYSIPEKDSKEDLGKNVYV